MFKKSKPAPQSDLFISDLLFADESLEKVAAYAKKSNDALPWLHFAIAEQMLKQGKKSKAIDELKRILEIRDLETRIYLQTWYCLRILGEFPSKEVSTQIQGIVVEVTLDRGLDILAAYAAHSARYFNFSGASIIWNAPDSEIENLIDDLLVAGQKIVDQIGVWEKPRLPAPPKDFIRINFLTYGGLYFGQGKFELLAKDPLGGLVVNGGLNLMKLLIKRKSTFTDKK